MILKVGAVGDGVKALQAALNATGYQPPLEVDGEFGPLTLTAVYWFQASSQDSLGRPLEVDGEAGPLTNGALGAVLDEDGDDPDTQEHGLRALAMKSLGKALEYHAADIRERPLGSNKGGPAPGKARKHSVDAIQAPFFPNAGQPWCAMAIWQWLTQAGLGIGTDGFAAVINWANWARGKGYWNPADGFSPLPGDIFCIGACTSFATAHHIGMVEYQLNAGQIVTIEGNYQNRVASIVRNIAGSIRGYIRIPGK